jgi:hypothetical protein
MMDAVNDSIINDYLDWVDRQVALRTYDLWRLAYRRGMVSDAELTAFLCRHERETARLYYPVEYAGNRRNSHV